MYYPPIAAAALFTAIVIVDVIKGESSSIATHAFLGLLSIGAVTFLSMKGADFVAWGILVLPMFIILLSFVLVYVGSPIVNKPTSTVVAPPSVTTTSVTTPTGASSAPTTSGQTINLPNLGNGTLSTTATVTPSASSCSS